MFDRFKTNPKRDNLSHQLDERTISFLRVLNNPEKDYLYKANVYEALCEYLEIDKVTTAGEKYDHFVQLATRFIPYLEKDEELIELCNSYIPKDFKFNSINLIFQDAVYNMLISVPASRDNKKFMSRLFNELKEEIENEEHPLMHHVWVDKNTESYRQVSIFPNTSQISITEMHYELYRYSKEICFEVHPEGNLEFKRSIQSFINDFPASYCNLQRKKWHEGVGNKAIDKGEHFKLVPKTKIPYDLNPENYEKVKSALLSQFKSLYKDFNEPFLEFLKANENKLENVQQEFINWLVNKPKSNYFSNDEDTLRRYLNKYNTYFHIDVFEVSKSNYESIINIIDQVAYKDESSEFFKYSEKESAHRPRAILGETNYFQFLRQKFKDTNTVVKEDLSYSPALNQIFYGPPGTGKTYKTILEAAKIVSQNTEIEYSEAQRVFNENLGSQIEFITFHQNYSYEDFIQGLRPDVEAGGELSFYKSDGVFKKIADRALKNYKESNTKVQKKRDFSDVFEEFIFPLVEGEVEEIEIKMRKVSFFITNVKDKSIEFRKTSGGTDHTLSIGTLEEMYDEESIKGIKGLASYYRPLLEELLQRGKLNETEHIIRKNYVIIIDEINRANISRVFGELITLIEKDKRYGGNIPLTATLPSGDRFIVPSNLYIIGTMNTADKSIALLDIALRRRFEFVPMYPKSESTEDKVVHDGDILEAINKGIISRKGHDFTIGHSYFMGDDYDLKHTIDNKVIPLLLEYFMNDDKEVKQILGAAQLVVEGWPMQYIPND